MDCITNADLNSLQRDLMRLLRTTARMYDVSISNPGKSWSAYSLPISLAVAAPNCP